MNHSLLAKLLLPLATLACAACSTAMPPVNMEAVDVAPTLPMAKTKVQTPLFILLDAGKVPDTIHIPKGRVKSVDVSSVQSFVRRDLKRVLEARFERVEVVEDAAQLPEAFHYRSDVRLDRLDTHYDAVRGEGGTAGRVFGRMKWAFALQPSDQEEYLYSYAGDILGEYALTHVRDAPQMFASTFEVALELLAKDMIEKDVDGLIADAERRNAGTKDMPAALAPLLDKSAEQMEGGGLGYSGSGAGMPSAESTESEE